MVENQTNILSLLKIWYRWKKQIVSTLVGTLIISIVVLLLIPNYYKSTAIFYVASPDQSMPNTIGDRELSKDFFGNDDDIDRIITIAESSEWANHMIQQFRLYEHFDIDSTAEKAPLKVREKFDKMFSIIQNSNNALELSFEDKNKRIVADMANHGRFMIEQIVRRVIKTSQKKAIENYELSIVRYENNLSKLGTELNEVKQEYSIYDTNNQTEFLNKNLIELIQKENTLLAQKNNGQLSTVRKNIEKTKALLKRYNEGLPTVKKLEQEYEEATVQMIKEKERYKLLKSAYNAESPIVIIVEDAFEPIQKSRPKRAILLFGIMVFTLIMSLLVVLVLDKVKTIDWDTIKTE